MLIRRVCVTMRQTWWQGHGAQSAATPGRPCQMLFAGQCAASETGSAPQVWWFGPRPSEPHLGREPCAETGGKLWPADLYNPPAVMNLLCKKGVMPEELVEVSVLHVLKHHDQRVALHTNSVEGDNVLVLKVRQQLGLTVEILPGIFTGLFQRLCTEVTF